VRDRERRAPVDDRHDRRAHRGRGDDQRQRQLWRRRSGKSLVRREVEQLFLVEVDLEDAVGSLDRGLPRARPPSSPPTSGARPSIVRWPCSDTA